MTEMLHRTLQDLLACGELKAVISTFVMVLSSSMGGAGPTLAILVSLWVIDFGLGFARAVKEERVNARKFKSGVFKMILYGIGILVFGLLDTAAGLSFPFIENPLRDSFIFYLCVGEVLSCIDHLSYFGLSVPEECRKKLIRYREKIELSNFSAPSSGGSK